MYEVKIDKTRSESRPLDEGYFGVYIDRLINKVATSFLGTENKRGSFRDLQAGLLGVHVQKYEVRDRGGIEKWEFLTPGLGYHIIIKLIGFGEKDKTFRDLKRRLEEIAAMPNAEEIERRLEKELSANER